MGCTITKKPPTFGGFFVSGGMNGGHTAVVDDLDALITAFNEEAGLLISWPHTQVIQYNAAKLTVVKNTPLMAFMRIKFRLAQLCANISCYAAQGAA